MVFRIILSVSIDFIGTSCIVDIEDIINTK